MPCLEVSKPQELAIELNDGRRVAPRPIWLRERCRDLLGEATLAPADHDVPAPRLWDAAMGEVRRFA